MIKWLAIWLVTFGCLGVCAQSGGPARIQVSGKVEDTAGVALVGATVRLIDGEDTVNEVTGDDGRFVFTLVATKEFRLGVTIRGYIPFSQVFPVPNGKAAITIAAIAMHVTYDELEPAMVTRVRPVVINGDTVSYNSTAFPVRDGSVVEDILKRLPGVEVDMNGNVIVQGKVVSKVILNGKGFFGGDVLLAIQNLPADIVDKLQIIDDYGDKARLTGIKTGEAEKVLNIVTKVDKSMGEFGRVSGAPGQQGKYEVGGFANAFRGDRQASLKGDLDNNNPLGSDRSSSLDMSYADQWTRKLGGSMGMIFTNHSPQMTSTQQSMTDYPGQELEQTTKNRNASKSNGDNFNTRMVYKTGDFSFIRLTVDGRLGRETGSNTTSLSDFQVDSGVTKQTTGLVLLGNHSVDRSISSALYAEKTWPESRRRFSVDVRFKASDVSQNGTQISNTAIQTDSGTSASKIENLNSNLSRNLETTVRIDYFIPLGKSSFLEPGYEGRSTETVSDLKTMIPDSATNIPQIIDSLSGTTKLYAFVQDAHLGISGKTKKLYYSAGVDAGPNIQHGTVDKNTNLIDYRYIAFLPRAAVTWDIGKRKKLNISYNGSPTAPTPQELSPITNISNPQYPATGNPGLRPGYTNNLSILYEFSNTQATKYSGYGVGINYGETHNSVVQNLSIGKDSSQVIQSTSWINAGISRTLIINYHATATPLIWNRLRVNLNGSVTTTQSLILLNGVQYSTDVLNWVQSLHTQVLIPDLFIADLYATYNKTHTDFSVAAPLRNDFQSLSLTCSNRHYFFKRWILDYQIVQTYLNSGRHLETQPAMATASIERQFLSHNMATTYIRVYNLFDQTAISAQSISGSTITQTVPNLAGRYFMIGLILNLRHFE